MLNDLLKESSFTDVLRDLLIPELKDQLIPELKDQFIDEGMRESVRLVLEGRFGALSEDVLAAITAAGEPALKELLRHAGTESLEQLCMRLGLT